MNTANLDTARSIVMAAETYADALARAARSARPKVPMKECSRCHGKGYDYFMGGSRAPGQCFKCWGAGEVVAGRKDAEMLAGLYARAEVERLRVLYRGFSLALAFTREAERCGEFLARHDRETMERRLASIVEAGKAAAKEAA